MNITNTTSVPTYAPTTVSSRNPFDVSGVEWPEILSTLQVNGLLCVVLLILFEWKRRKHPAVYSPRSINSDYPNSENERRILSWLGWTVRLRDDELRRMIGLDAFMLLRFTRMWKRIFFWSTIFGCSVLIPVYTSGLRNQSGFYRYTMRNLKKGQTRLWAPMIFVYIFSALVLRSLDNEGRAYLKWRREFLSGIAMEAHDYQSRCSVLLERLPPYLRTEGTLKKYFEYLVGVENVHSVIVFLDLRDLEKKLRRRDRAIQNLLRILENKEKKASFCSSLSSIFFVNDQGAAANELDTSDQAFLQARDRALADERKLASLTGRSFQEQSSANYSNEKRSSFYFFDSSPLEWLSRQIFTPKEDTMTTDTLLSSVPREREERGFIQQASKRILEHTSHATVDVLRQAGDLTTNLTTTTISGLATTLALDEVSTKNYEPSSTGVVTFTNPGIAADVSQLSLTATPLGIEASGPLPPPTDIVWSNITLAADNIETRTLLADCWLWLCALCWTPLIAALQVVANLDEMARVFPFLKPFVTEDRYEYLRSIATGLIPVTLLLCLLALVPILLEYLAKSYVGLKTHSSIQRFILSRYFYFQLLSIFVTILAGSLSATLKAFIRHPRSLFELLGKSLPTISAYFMQTLCVKTLFSLFLELSRPLPYLFTSAKQKIHTYILRSRISFHEENQNNLIPDFRVGRTGPEFLMVVLIGTTYAPIAPFILFIATIFFAFADAVYTRQFLFVYKNTFEGGGLHLWPALTYFSILALVASQLTTLSYLSLLQAVHQAPLLIPLPIVTILFYRGRLVRFYEKPAVHLDRETAIANNLRDPQYPMKACLRSDFYRHPALVAESKDSKTLLASLAEEEDQIEEVENLTPSTQNPLQNAPLSGGGESSYLPTILSSSFDEFEEQAGVVDDDGSRKEIQDDEKVASY